MGTPGLPGIPGPIGDRGLPGEKGKRDFLKIKMVKSTFFLAANKSENNQI